MGSPAEDYLLSQEDTTLEEYVAHYASKYYDPVKAKAYYERAKQRLKSTKRSKIVSIPTLRTKPRKENLQNGT